jgi:hypothetical protein
MWARNRAPWCAHEMSGAPENSRAKGCWQLTPRQTDLRVSNPPKNAALYTMMPYIDALKPCYIPSMTIQTFQEPATVSCMNCGFCALYDDSWHFSSTQCIKPYINITSGAKFAFRPLPNAAGCASRQQRRRFGQQQKIPTCTSASAPGRGRRYHHSCRSC